MKEKGLHATVPTNPKTDSTTVPEVKLARKRLEQARKIKDNVQGGYKNISTLPSQVCWAVLNLYPAGQVTDGPSKLLSFLD